MKKALLPLFVLLMGASADAASIIVQTGSPANTVVRSNGAPLNSGTAVIGFFRNYTTGMDSSLRDPSASIRQFVQNNFVSIGVIGVSDVDYGNPSPAIGLVSQGNGTSSVSGGIEASNWLTASASITANSEQPNGLVRGTRIFMLIYDTSSIATATDLGIYSATTWTIPTAGALETLSMTMTQVDTAAEAYRGGIGSLVLAPVPEPAISGLLAVAGLMTLRRRQK